MTIASKVKTPKRAEFSDLDDFGYDERVKPDMWITAYGGASFDTWQDFADQIDIVRKSTYLTRSQRIALSRWQTQYALKIRHYQHVPEFLTPRDMILEIHAMRDELIAMTRCI